MSHNTLFLPHSKTACYQLSTFDISITIKIYAFCIFQWPFIVSCSNVHINSASAYEKVSEVNKKKKAWYRTFFSLYDQQGKEKWKNNNNFMVTYDSIKSAFLYTRQKERKPCKSKNVIVMSLYDDLCLWL